ncbi:MAG: 50S ribosomal protein L29 [Verrucomicrobia bacterium]|nr:50S ribosomal protein L29 [Verrucomicrobiota bacterium]
MKSLTLILCVVALLGAAASTFFYFQIGNTKTRLEQQVTLANGRTADVQAKLTDATGQIDTLQKRLAAMDSDLGEAKSRATASDSRSVQLARDVAQLRNQITAKDEAAQSLNTEIADLKRELTEAKTAAAAVSPEEIENYKKTIATLQTRVSELEAGRPKVVNADGTVTTVAPVTPGLTGQILSVGSHNAFVVINLGSTKGVQVNQRFTITREGNTLATGVVSSVGEGYAIAQIVPDSLRGTLAKGDTATIVAQ